MALTLFNLRRLALVVLALGLATPALARHYPRPHIPSSYLVTVQTSARKQITVARHLAVRFQKLIADLVAAGYHPETISCYASGGHVPHSRHYAGAACDFDGSLSRSPFMRTATANRIIVKNRFRNGCTFTAPFYRVRDCGHVDDGYIHIRSYRRHKSW